MEENLVRICLLIQTSPGLYTGVSVIDCRCTALFNVALIRSLLRINKDGGGGQPSLEAGVTSADRQDELLLPNLSPYANHTSRNELGASPLAAPSRVGWRRGAAGGETTPAKEDRREPQKPASSQKWVSREVRRPPGTLCAKDCVQMRSRYPPGGGTHVAVVPLHVSSYPVGSLQKESRGRWNVNHARLCLLVRRHAADLAQLMRPRVRLAHLRPCVCAHTPEGVYFAGLGDNYSQDRLFPGTRYSNKRSREMEGASERAAARFGGQHSRQTASD